MTSANEERGKRKIWLTAEIIEMMKMKQQKMLKIGTEYRVLNKKNEECAER